MTIIGGVIVPVGNKNVWVDTESWKKGQQKLLHAEGEAVWFYRQPPKPALSGLGR